MRIKLYLLQEMYISSQDVITLTAKNVSTQKKFQSILSLSPTGSDGIGNDLSQ